jgi:hypothetical protein
MGDLLNSHPIDSVAQKLKGLSINPNPDNTTEGAVQNLGAQLFRGGATPYPVGPVMGLTKGVNGVNSTVMNQLGMASDDTTAGH